MEGRDSRKREAKERERRERHGLACALGIKPQGDSVVVNATSDQRERGM